MWAGGTPRQKGRGGQEGVEVGTRRERRHGGGDSGGGGVGRSALALGGDELRGGRGLGLTGVRAEDAHAAADALGAEAERHVVEVAC
jgi:hypothetical protein